MLRKNGPGGQTESGLTAISIFRSNKYAFIVIIIAVLFLCSLYFGFQWNVYQSAAKSEAINLAQAVEALFHEDHIKELSASPDDLGKPEYESAKIGLMQLVKTSNNIRFAYMYGEQNGNIVFWVDSEQPDSPDYSPPGQVYQEASAATWQPLLTGEAVLTNPETDRWGTWISALIPIADPATGGTIAVLGLDFDAAAWYADIWSNMVPVIMIIAIILVLCASLMHIWLHRQLYKNLSRKLELDEALYHSVFEQAPIGIAVVKNTTIASPSLLGDISVNPVFQQILQRTSQELQNVKWTEITHPDDVQADIDQFDRFQKGEIDSYSMEKRYIRPNGSVIWTHMKISPLVSLPFRRTMHLCLLEDISQRKNAEDKLKESERSKSVLLSNLPGMAYRCDFDRDWTMHFVSDGCYKLTGYTPYMLIGNNKIAYNSIIAPEYREYIWDQCGVALGNGTSFRFEYEIIAADGSRKWVLEMGEGVYNEQGEVEALEGIILDITDRKKFEEQLQQMLSRTQNMINNHQAVMLLLEPYSGAIIEANQAATEFYGYTKDELLSMSIQDINMLDKEEIRLLRLKILEKGRKYFTFPHRLKNGEIRIVDVYSSPIEYDDRKVLFSIIFDVTKREEIARQNEYLAYHDYLTGLYNRRFYEEEFRRRNERNLFPIGVFLGDIDGFKEYNDTYGHAEGDKILRKVAVNLRSMVEKDGTLARIGGDEFAIIVSGVDKVEMRKCLDKLNHESDNDNSGASPDELPTISWGYALQRDAGDTLDTLEEEAEPGLPPRSSPCILPFIGMGIPSSVAGRSSSP
ncbi:MAG TPA: PAS domain S-box protein [Candidatus Limiplasma sp.]|nr:PAS domain S-box protein [Candidatus Limiplasma sp.]